MATDTRCHSHFQAEQMVPDVKDIVGILRSSGFFIRNVKICDTNDSVPQTSYSGTCRVVMACAKSGLLVEMESEGECRCPETDTASVWCVLSPTSSQESLDKTRDQAGSSLLPEMSGVMTEVVGEKMRYLMKLMDSRGTLRRQRSWRESFGQEPRRRSAGEGAAEPLISEPRPGLHHSLGDKEWEQVTSSTCPFPTENIHSVADGGTGEGVNVGNGDDSSMALAMSLSGSQSFSQSISASEKQLLLAGVIGPPRRQSSTLEDYALLRKTSRETLNVIVPVPPLLTPTKEGAVEGHQPSTETFEDLARKGILSFLPPEARDCLHRAEVAVKIISDMVEMLKSWSVSEEDPIEGLKVNDGKQTSELRPPTPRLRHGIPGSRGRVKRSSTSSVLSGGSSSPGHAHATADGSSRAPLGPARSSLSPAQRARVKRRAEAAEAAAVATRRRSLESATPPGRSLVAPRWATSKATDTAIPKATGTAIPKAAVSRCTPRKERSAHLPVFGTSTPR